MWWVVLFVGIAVLGLAMVVGYGIWLAHLAADVLSEVAVLGNLLGRLGDLAGEIRMTSGPGGPTGTGSALAFDGARFPGDTDVR